MDAQQKSYNECVKKIDNLIDMRAGGEISEQQFKNKKAKIVKEKMHLQELLKDTNNMVGKNIIRIIFTAPHYLRSILGANDAKDLK